MRYGYFKHHIFNLAAALMVFTNNAYSQTADTSLTTKVTPLVHIIYMGGNDCPPCVVWRALELPKLEKSDEFKSFKFSFVTKSVRSAVPSSIFLPVEVKPYKQKLDYATGGRGGSSQTVLMADGEVYHHFYGSRTAEQYVNMALAIQNGTPFPESRCTRRNQTSCVEAPKP